MPEHPSPSFPHPSDSSLSPRERVGVRGDLDPIHHIRHDLLSRPVRSYADKLNAELRSIWQELGIKTMAEFDRLTQEKKIPEPVVIKYRDLLARLSEVVRSGKFPPDYPVVEYKEHTLDLNEVLKASHDFYESHNLPFLADALDDVILRLTNGERDRITFALEQGFTSALILPPPDLLQKHLDNLINECAAAPSDQLTGNNKYRDPDIENETKIFPPVNRPSSSYLLLYSRGSVPEETKGNTAENLITHFDENEWNGLTIPEYLLLQRIEAERRRDHSFDVFISNDPISANWTWLLDSRISSAVAYAYWNPVFCQIGVQSYNPKSTDVILGARPAVVVALE